MPPSRTRLGIRLALADVLTAPINEYAEAEKICRDLIAKDKTASQPYMQLYQLLLMQGRLTEAEDILKLAVDNNPKEFGYLTMLARHYYVTKRRDDMVKVLDQIKSHAKENPNAYITVGDFYYRLGDAEEAIKQYKDGIQADPKRKATYQKHMIEVLMHQGQRGRAAEVNDEILKENPKDATTSVPSTTCRFRTPCSSLPVGSPSTAAASPRPRMAASTWTSAVPGTITTTCRPEPRSWSSEPCTLRRARAVDPGTPRTRWSDPASWRPQPVRIRPGNMPGIMFLRSDPSARDSQTRHPDDGVRPT